jgi:hypothetical protein
MSLSNSFQFSEIHWQTFFPVLLFVPVPKQGLIILGTFGNKFIPYCFFLLCFFLFNSFSFIWLELSELKEEFWD